MIDSSVRRGVSEERFSWSSHDLTRATDTTNGITRGRKFDSSALFCAYKVVINRWVLKNRTNNLLLSVDAAESPWSAGVDGVWGPLSSNVPCQGPMMPLSTRDTEWWSDRSGQFWFVIWQQLADSYCRSWPLEHLGHEPREGCKPCPKLQTVCREDDEPFLAGN